MEYMKILRLSTSGAVLASDYEGGLDEVVGSPNQVDTAGLEGGAGTTAVPT
jgi:hypothetical protein